MSFLDVFDLRPMFPALGSAGEILLPNPFSLLRSPVSHACGWRIPTLI